MHKLYCMKTEWDQARLSGLELRFAVQCVQQAADVNKVLHLHVAVHNIFWNWSCRLGINLI